MAARTTQKSGSVSDNTVWDGGTALADGDSITIAAGHTLTWDWDKSAWTTGVAGIVITSHATTPAKLTFPSANGTYILPLKAGATIAGTNAANFGQFHIGSAGSPPGSGVYIKIEFLGTTTGTKVDGTYLDVQLFAGQPTNKYCRLTGAEAVAQTVIEVDTDVSTDWAANDTVVICDVQVSEWERYTIQSIAAGAITLSSGLTVAKSVGAFLVKVNRNVEFVANLAATGSDAVGMFANLQQGSTINVACRQTLGNTNANRTGTLLRGCTGVTLGGVAHGFNNVFNGTIRCEMSGVAAGFSTFDGTASTLNVGTVLSGAAIGFGALIGNYCRITSTGLIACSPAAGVSDADIAGTVIACYVGLRGRIILRQGSVIGGSGSQGGDANACDVWYANSAYRSVVVGYGTRLRSATQVSGYLTHCDFPLGTVTLYDVADGNGTPQPGQIAWWCGGGYGKSEAWAGATHDPGSNFPGIPPAFVHKANFESALGRCFVDIPIECESNRPVRLTVWARKIQNGMAQTPKAQLIDPNKPWGDPNEAVATVTMADDQVWQTLWLKYDNGNAPKQLALRVWGANAGGALYWNWAIHHGAVRHRPIHLGV